MAEEGAETAYRTTAGIGNREDRMKPGQIESKSLGGMAVASLDLSQCQRWHQGHDRYRPAGEVFDSTYAGVAAIDAATAKAFVTRHHYARSFPASRVNVGIFLKEPFKSEELCGVATFSVPMSQNVIPAYFDQLAPNQGVELGRLVLLEKLAANAETWFLKRAFRVLRERLSDVRGIVSYSDPIPRFNIDGQMVKKGHVGTIYKAHNAQYRGRSKARTLLLTPEGNVANERSLSKVRNNERGSDGVQQELLRAGAPERCFGESGADWISRLIETRFLRRVAHPGNHCFTWELR